MHISHFMSPTVWYQTCSACVMRKKSACKRECLHIAVFGYFTLDQFQTRKEVVTTNLYFWRTWCRWTFTGSPNEGGGRHEVVWDSPQGPEGLQWAAWLNRLRVLRFNRGVRGRKLCWFWRWFLLYVSWSHAGLTFCSRDDEKKIIQETNLRT